MAEHLPHHRTIVMQNSLGKKRSNSKYDIQKAGWSTSALPRI